MIKANRQLAAGRARPRKRPLHREVFFLLALAGMGLAASVLLGAGEITLDGSLPGGAYEGLGGLSAGGGTRLLADYPETQKSQILDLLFKPKFGASLQHLKIENGGDAESTFGTEPAMMRSRHEYERATAALDSPNPNDPQYADVRAMFRRGYEFWLAAEGRKRNPKLRLDSLQWGAPGWIGDGTLYSQDNADYLVNFIKGARAYWNLDFDFIGGNQNEAYNPGDWVKTLRKTLDTAGLAKVKVNVVDLYEDELTKFQRSLDGDVELQRATYAIGSHYVIEWWKEGHFLKLIESDTTRSQHAQHLWIGEDTAQAWKVANAAGLYPFALYNAALFNRNHVLCKATMPGEYCFPVCAWLAAMDYTWNNDGIVNCYEPWSGHYEVTPSLWAVAHTTQFMAPGWIYLGGTGCGLLSGGGSYVALRAPAPGKGGCDFSVVIETKDATNDQTLNFTLVGPLSRGLRHVWESFGTNDATWFTNPEGRLSAKRGDSFSITVRPNSIVTITTTTGQQKGTVRNIPPSVRFPATYAENFESYSERQTPKYLSDYYGAFEVTTDSDPAHNKCLQQQITSPVIKWFRLDGRNYTQTLIGDKDWKNYEVSVEAKMDTAGFVEIGARCVPYRDNELIGPHLKVTIDGRWVLEDSDGAVLASGNVPGFRGTDWHRYRLRCVAQSVAGSIDGAEKAVAPTVQSHGAVYLATSRNLTKFDNLAIVPLNEPQPGPASFESTVTFGSTRNDFTGDVGMKVAVGSEDLAVVELGRACAPGNAGTHILKLTRASDGAVLANTEISMAAGTPDIRGFKYARLAAPVVLASNTACYVTSSEAAGGDFWYEPGESLVATDTDAKIYGVYHEKEAWLEKEAGHSAGVNLKYLCDSFASRVTLGTARTNFSGEVGMKVTVGTMPLTVTQLGRSFLPGNRGTHTAKIIRARDNVVLGQADIDLSIGAPDWRGFKYAALSKPITLAPDTAYYITTTEKDGGDSWYDVGDSTIRTDTGAAISGVYHEGGAWHEMTPGHFYGGVNLKLVPDPSLLFR